MNGAKKNKSGEKKKNKQNSRQINGMENERQ